MMNDTFIDIAILIVDDNPAKLLSLVAILENLDLTIVTATSGQEALRQLLLRDFAAVLLDVNMPIMDGFETATLIRQRPRYEHLPVIFVTAERVADVERLAGYQIGAVDYITSPIVPEVLRAKIIVFADLYRLHTLAVQYAQKIQQQNQVIAVQNQQLLESNQSLEQRIAEEVANSREKDYLLIQQSRLAMMGEMIGNIAHQWRQPLNALTLTLGNLKDAEAYHELTGDYLMQKITESQRLIDKMSSTIDDFRNFFRPDKNSVPFSLNQAVAAAVDLVMISFKEYNITIKIETDEEIWTTGIANEYSQALLNLLGNAKDSILAHSPPIEGLLVVKISQENQKARVTVTDNGVGINESARLRLFEPYFSTKENKTGIGLYMSKMIIENSMSGQIMARNVRNGAEFTLLTPLANRNPA